MLSPCLFVIAHGLCTIEVYSTKKKDGRVTQPPILCGSGFYPATAFTPKYMLALRTLRISKGFAYEGRIDLLSLIERCNRHQEPNGGLHLI